MTKITMKNHSKVHGIGILGMERIKKKKLDSVEIYASY